MYICTCIVQSFIPSSHVSEAIFSGATFIVLKNCLYNETDASLDPL